MSKRDGHKKRGRQKIKDPRNNQFRIRMNDYERDLFFEASDLSGLSHTETMREAIRRMVHDERKRVGDRNDERRKQNKRKEG